MIEKTCKKALFTERGAQPGHGLADVIFNSSFLALLRRACERMRAEGVVEQVASAGGSLLGHGEDDAKRKRTSSSNEFQPRGTSRDAFPCVWLGAGRA